MHKLLILALLTTPAAHAYALCTCEPLTAERHTVVLYPPLESNLVSPAARVLVLSTTTTPQVTADYQQNGGLDPAEGTLEALGRVGDNYLLAWAPLTPFPQGVRVTVVVDVGNGAGTQTHYRIGAAPDTRPPSLPSVALTDLTRAEVLRVDHAGESCEPSTRREVSTGQVSITGATDDKTRAEFLLYKTYVYAEGSPRPATPTRVTLGGWQAPPASCAPITDCGAVGPTTQRWVWPDTPRVCVAVEAVDTVGNSSGVSTPACADVRSVSVVIDEATGACVEQSGPAVDAGARPSPNTSAPPTETRSSGCTATQARGDAWMLGVFAVAWWRARCRSSARRRPSPRPNL